MAVAVLQDHHMLGKRIVLSTLRSAGYDPLDYERMEPDELVERVVEDRVEVIMISTLMLASALKVRVVRDGLAGRGCRARIVVGGAPFRLDTELGRRVGADEAGMRGTDAVAILRRLTGGVR